MSRRENQEPLLGNQVSRIYTENKAEFDDLHRLTKAVLQEKFEFPASMKALYDLARKRGKLITSISQAKKIEPAELGGVVSKNQEKIKVKPNYAACYRACMLVLSQLESYGENQTLAGFSYQYFAGYAYTDQTIIGQLLDYSDYNSPIEEEDKKYDQAGAGVTKADYEEALSFIADKDLKILSENANKELSDIIPDLVESLQSEVVQSMVALRTATTSGSDALKVRADTLHREMERTGGNPEIHREIKSLFVAIPNFIRKSFRPNPASGSQKDKNRNLILNLIKNAKTSGTSVDLSGQNLSGMDFSNLDLSGANLRGADFRGANLRGANLSGCDLQGADFRGAIIRDTNFSRAHFDEKTAFSSHFLQGNFYQNQGFTFTIVLTHEKSVDIEIFDAKSFMESAKKKSIQQLYFDAYKSQIRDFLTNSTSLLESEKKSRVENLILLADKLGLKRDLSGLDLSGADLSGINLCGVDFRNTDLSGANFEGAVIDARTDFRRTNVTGTFGNPSYEIYSINREQNLRCKTTKASISQIRDAQANPGDGKKPQLFVKSLMDDLKAHLKQKSLGDGITFSDLTILLDTARFYVNRDEDLTAELTLSNNFQYLLRDPYSGEMGKVNTTCDVLRDTLGDFLTKRYPTKENNSDIMSLLLFAYNNPNSEEKKALNNALLEISHKPAQIKEKIQKEARIKLEKIRLGKGNEDLAVGAASTPQSQFQHGEVSEIVFGSRVVTDDYSKSTRHYAGGHEGNIATLAQRSRNIIVHPVFDQVNTVANVNVSLLIEAAPTEPKEAGLSERTETQTPESINEPKTVHYKTDNLQNSSDSNSFEEVETPSVQKTESIKAANRTIHIVPEVGKGLIGQHIRLRIITQEVGQTVDEAYKSSVVFDPRRTIKPFDVFNSSVVSLGVQNMTDDTNCGRYVAAMAIQAAGLARDGIPINADTLQSSPAVSRALHFSDQKNAQVGLENSYVRPLKYCYTSQQILQHFRQILACLKSEYLARGEKGESRDLHGQAVFGGYSKASVFTTLFSKIGFAHTAEEKLRAVEKIEASLKTDEVLDLKKLPDAAKQGALGDCVKSMIQVQRVIQQENDDSFRLRR